MDLEEKKKNEDYMKEKYPWINRKVNIVYLLLGAVDIAIEELNSILISNKLDLYRNDKVLLNNIIKTYKSLQNGIRKLQDNSVYQSKTMIEGEKNLYEDSVYRLYYIFLALLDRGGGDEKLCDVRLYYLMKFIMGFKSLLGIPNLDFNIECAFIEVRNNILEGKYTKEELKNLLKKNEPEDKQIEDTLSR